mmetsp:Transcript_12683/g.21353  ORF Transcript_12683/g.21353 Transcript_12683/m.21353 type:complete len:98 (+) Transcript_12683:3796-4089(+)
MMGLVEIPKDFRVHLGVLIALNALCSYVFEKFFIGWFGRFWERRQQSKTKLRQARHLDQLDRNAAHDFQEDHSYGQKGVRVPQNSQLRDGREETGGG